MSRMQLALNVDDLDETVLGRWLPGRHNFRQ
jgi:hypothetical protein